VTSHLVENLLVFGRLLRAGGLDVHMGRMLDVLKALQYIDIGARDEVYHTCRTLLVHRREDLAIFDRTFDRFWSRRDAQTPRVRVDDRRESDLAAGSPSAVEMLGDASGGEGEGGALHTWSAAEALAAKDFADFTADEMAVARAAIDRLT